MCHAANWQPVLFTWVSRQCSGGNGSSADRRSGSRSVTRLKEKRAGHKTERDGGGGCGAVHASKEPGPLGTLGLRQELCFHGPSSQGIRSASHVYI
jgi:hypothetical protein